MRAVEGQPLTRSSKFDIEQATPSVAYVIARGPSSEAALPFLYLVNKSSYPFQSTVTLCRHEKAAIIRN